MQVEEKHNATHKNNFRSTLPGHVRIFTGLCNMDHILVALTPPFIPFLSGHTALNASCCFTQERDAHIISLSLPYIYLRKENIGTALFLLCGTRKEKLFSWTLKLKHAYCLVTKITFGYLYAFRKYTYNVWRFGLTCNKGKMSQIFTVTNVYMYNQIQQKKVINVEMTESRKINTYMYY